jgi:DNA primase small subunit
MDVQTSPTITTLAPSAPSAPVPVPIKIASSDTFNVPLLNFYYVNYFPFKQLTRWLSYGNDAESRALGNIPDFLYRREFTLTLINDTYVRYQCYKNAQEFADAVVSRHPERIEIGPVYTHPPTLSKTIDKSIFKPVERELIFDLDLNDYDDIRTCCTGANICKRCWSFMSVAISMLDQVLREDFGFKHILFVYSGRRGVHCHVADEQARQLTNEERSAVIEYVNAISADSSGSTTGDSKTNINRVMNSLTLPLHPAFARAFAILENEFSQNVIRESGQGLLCKKENWDKILDMLPKLPDDFQIDDRKWNLRETIQSAWETPGHSPMKRWNILKSTISALLERTGGKPSEGTKKSDSKADPKVKLPMPMRKTLEKLIPAIVFTYIYPRLDVNVSKHRNHLLKSPFCIHPKTGKVCVPIDVNSLKDFDPVTVPTCSQLMSQGMKYLQSQNNPGAGGSTSGKVNLDNTLYKHSAMKPYIEYFENWLQDLEETNGRSRREHAQDLASKREASEWGVGGH